MEKLENEGLINGLRASKGSSNKILMAFLDNVNMSAPGIHYVEKKLLPADGYVQFCEKL